MSKKQMYVFTEHNQVEDETWCFYIPMTEEEFEHIEMLIDDPVVEPETYAISGPVTDKVVKTLLKHGNVREGYMPAHNLCVGAVQNIMDLTVADAEADVFYKGQLWERVK